MNLSFQARFFQEKNMRYAHIIVLFSIAILCQTAWSDPCYVTTAASGTPQ